MVAIAHHSVAGGMSRPCPIDEWNGQARCEHAEAWIDNEPFVADGYGQEHVRPRGHRSRLVEGYACRMASRPKSECLEDGCEQRCVLEAIAAAMSPDELVLQTLQVETHGAA